jgi:hypothetical protein
MSSDSYDREWCDIATSGEDVETSLARVVLSVVRRNGVKSDA